MENKINQELLVSDLNDEEINALVDTIKNATTDLLSKSLYSFLNLLDNRYEFDRLIADKATNIIGKIKADIPELVNEELKDLDKDIIDFKVFDILRNYDKKQVK